jgi:WD40 repeat protein
MSRFQADAPGVGVAFAGGLPAHGFGDGRIRVGDRWVRAHEGGLLALAPCPTGKAVLTAGDDGRVVRTGPDGTVGTLLDLKGGWLDCLATTPGRAAGPRVAAAAGRTAHLIGLGARAGTATLDLPRPPTALALSRDGALLAAAHGAGASLHDLDDPGASARALGGAGGHVSIAFSPDGRFLVAGTAEPALAGWRLSDGQGFKMGGYPGKPLALVFAAEGQALLTSGGPALLVWPFTGPRGPMGESADLHRPRLGLCTMVAAHGILAAAGWSDGGVDVVRLDTLKSRHVAGPRPPKDLDFDPREAKARITGLAFSADGKRLAWCCEDGSAGLERL